MDSPSRDSGLGGDSAAGVDSLTNGLSSMGLGGRAGAFYGNQGGK